jgi:hypothetical protein
MGGEGVKIHRKLRDVIYVPNTSRRLVLSLDIRLKQTSLFDSKMFVITEFDCNRILQRILIE